MTDQTVILSKREFQVLSKKAKLADDVLFQLKASLEDIKAGRIHRAVH